MLLFPAAGEDDHDPAQDDQPYRCLTGVKSHSEEVDEQSCGQYGVEYMHLVVCGWVFGLWLCCLDKNPVSGSGATISLQVYICIHTRI